MKNRFFYAVALGTLTTISGCQTETKYGDAGATETVNADWGSTDLQMVAEKMVQSLLSDPILGEGQKPAIALGNIDNRTNEYIDTQLILSKISTSLVGSKKVRLIATDQGQGEIGKQIAHQQSGVVSAASAKAFGKQVGADFVLYGRLANIEKKGGSTQDVYFNLTLHLVNVETAVTEWQEEKEIRKTTKKSGLGW